MTFSTFGFQSFRLPAHAHPTSNDNQRISEVRCYDFHSLNFSQSIRSTYTRWWYEKWKIWVFDRVIGQIQHLPASHFTMKIMEIPIYVHFSCKMYIFSLSAGLLCDICAIRQKNLSFFLFHVNVCNLKKLYGKKEVAKNTKRIQSMEKHVHPPMKKIRIFYGTWQKRGWWKILYSMLRTTSNEMELFVLNQCGDSA